MMELVKTVTLKIDGADPRKSMTEIDRAAEALRAGGLVAFPTETVYGLGADALSPGAVKKIFEAKGRPADNPLIVHIARADDLNGIVDAANDVSDTARVLMERFWPGPLTLIFKKRPAVPYETSGGLETVGVRMPSNEAARLLIARAGLPVAAPSANSSGKPSPTKAAHVEFDLNGKIDIILDGGPARYGLESTIVDCAGGAPRLLRPGAVTLEMLEEAVGGVEVDPAVLRRTNGRPYAPGMRYTHYSPLADVTVVCGPLERVVGKIIELAAAYAADTGRTPGILATDQTAGSYDHERNIVLTLGDRGDPEAIGANLFRMLRKFDHYGAGRVYSESFEETGLGLAVMNRLKKASGYDIIEVGQRYQS